jgi:hypothetical protein
MDQPLPLHSFANSGFNEQVGRALFENAGANAILAVFAAAIFYDDGLDALEMQQMREHQPRRASSYDSNLRSHMHRER